MNEELGALIQEWARASVVAQEKYIEYLSCLSSLNKLSDELSLKIKEKLEQPHIDIGDFEIDG